MIYLLSEDVAGIRQWAQELLKVADDADNGDPIDIGDVRGIGASIVEMCDDPEYEDD